MRAIPPPSDSLESPCVRNCCLDDDNVCLGCGRSLDEIVAWSAAGDAQKRAILERSRVRVTERQLRHGNPPKSRSAP
jgi:predicted Fe-S protein YdhL (DUF1289 family)